MSLEPRKPRKETGVTRQKLRANKSAKSSTMRRFRVQLIRQKRCINGDGVAGAQRLDHRRTEKVVGRSKNRTVKRD